MRDADRAINDPHDDNRYEQSDMLGVPRSEHGATVTSTKGRYVDIPVETAGYPGKYEEGLEKRQRSYRDSEEASEIENEETF